ncbi:MAG TPA: dihydrofolate reductase [Candidatus Paceibacterota bacterium]|nr:dihydrofolate reductase [Candidatus Paceibacterota bacterium]
MKPRVSAIVAIGDDLVIGKGNGLLWHIPDDLKRFKELTLGHPVVMGRKTFDSILAILGKPLPGRTSIVITRDAEWSHDGAIVAHSLQEALKKASALDQEEVFVIGGGQIYKEAFDQLDRIYLTRIFDAKEGDTFFPPYEHVFTEKLFEEQRTWNDITYCWIDLDRPAATEDPS